MDADDGTVVQGRFSRPFGYVFEKTIPCQHDEIMQTLEAGIRLMVAASTTQTALRSRKPKVRDESNRSMADT